MDLTDAMIVKGEVDTEEPEPSVTNPSPATLESLIGSVAATVQLSPRARYSFVGFVYLGLFCFWPPLTLAVESSATDVCGIFSPLVPD